MRPQQVRMADLLKDQSYRKFFKRSPTLFQPQTLPGVEPWWLYVQRAEEGSWARRSTRTYAEAFTLAVKAIKKLDVHDLTIVSRRAAYRPPGDLEWPKSHVWCPYCRRPTVWWRFSRHHALRSFVNFDMSEVVRCTICGHSENDPIVQIYQVSDLAHEQYVSKIERADKTRQRRVRKSA